MVTEDYVSFEVAKLLRKKGFNGLCTAYYDCFTTDNFHCGYEPTDFNSIDTKIRDIVAAPTLQMAMKWLREEYNLVVNLVGRYVDGKLEAWEVYIYFLDSGVDATINAMEHIYGKTYEEATEAAIKYCLENLI